MTREDLILHITAIEVCELKEIERIKRYAKKQKKDLLNRWATENARFAIGDIISSLDTIIRIEKLIGHIDSHNVPYVEYYGTALTKQLKNRADGWMASIYDDSPERNIIKLK